MPPGASAKAPASESIASSPPTIAVVVLAHRRERYLADAVRSVLNQTVPRDRYEIVVTKAFRSEPVDRLLEENQIPALFDPEPRYGRKLARAVDATRAPFVTILEDDDLFEPDRLARVLQLVAVHPDLGYYHNRPSGITPDGDPLPRGKWQPQEVDADLDRAGAMWIPPAEKVSHAADLLRGASWFNVSSIAVRRELLVRAPKRYYQEVVMTSMDAFLCGLAWVSPYGMFLDDRRLTRYRHHPADFAMNIQTGRQGIADVRSIVEMMEDAGSAEGLHWVNSIIEESWKWLYLNNVKQSMRTGAPRAEVLRKAGAYARFVLRHPRWLRERGAWQSGADVAVYLLAPGRVERKLNPPPAVFPGTPPN
ncbi:MAG: glycosyltransferase family A protein [Thermoplasmata archaeon]|jgi:hypothetical protein